MTPVQRTVLTVIFVVLAVMPVVWVVGKAVWALVGMGKEDGAMMESESGIREKVRDVEAGDMGKGKV